MSTHTHTHTHELSRRAPDTNTRAAQERTRQTHDQPRHAPDTNTRRVLFAVGKKKVTNTSSPDTRQAQTRSVQARAKQTHDQPRHAPGTNTRIDQERARHKSPDTNTRAQTTAGTAGGRKTVQTKIIVVKFFSPHSCLKKTQPNKNTN